MQFNSIEYIAVFLPLVIAGWALLRGTRFANPFIFLASIYFYASSEVWYLGPLFVTALLDYKIAQMIFESSNATKRRTLVVASVVANLGLLGFFKYGPWVTGKAASIALAHGVVLPVISVGLPPAISFYTFQSMSYTIDIYRREFRPYKSVIDYLSFVTFFPHLVAGPIMRARDLLPQLARDRSLPSIDQVSLGLFMILFGLFQKVVIADNMAAVVDDISKQMIPPGARLAPGVGLMFAYAFAMQIYCDFAAYSLIARGSAKLLNVELMQNFATPYFSQSPSEFWRRWHISLSTWLRDYLYKPLGGNRNGRFATYRNLMLTMVIGGLWHGAGLLFILWGFWHGLLLVIYRVAPIDQWLARFGRIGRIAAAVLFFHLVCVGWIFFRASQGQLTPIFSSILALPQAFTTDDGGVMMTYLRVILMFGIPAFIFDWFGWRRGGEFPDGFLKLSRPAKILLSVGLFYAIVFFGRRVANEFIYFAF